MIANYLQILWSIILEIIFFNSYPHWLSLVGACFILVNAGIAIYKATTGTKASPKSVKDNKSKGKYDMLSSNDGGDEHVEIDSDEDEDHSNENVNGIRMGTLNKN